MNLFPILFEGESAILHWIEITSLVIEILAIVMIVIGVFGSTARYFYQIALRHEMIGKRYTEYQRYRHTLARTLMLGLEILVAADIVRTVALEPTFANVAVLGLLVMIRIVLGWSLVVEIEGRWPWQPERPETDNSKDV